MKTLTEMVHAYHAGEISLERIVDSVCEAVYRFPVTRTGFCEEDCAEFLIRFYPRIRRLVKRYRPQGSSFENYLATTLRFQLRSFARARNNERFRLATMTDPTVAGTIDVRESDLGAGPEAGSRETAGTGPPQCKPRRLTPGQSRRLVYLSLKASERLTPAACARIARIAGCDVEWLNSVWLSIRDECDTQRRRRDAARKVRDRAWFRTRFIETQLLNAAEQSERVALLQELDRWNTRLARARRVLARMPAGPTHQQIADALGIPKGTVDSGVFKGKRELRDPSYAELLADLAGE
jgi:RNA polymerase sigma factor (sigma-70 family)